MPRKPLLFPGRVPLFFILLAAFQLVTSVANAQMRQVYKDESPQHNPIHNISFYSRSAGYVAFDDWIGFTTDTGRSFSQKYITTGNIDYNGYPNNSIIGYINNGVKAIDQNTIIAYGQRIMDVIILRSTDGGNTFRMVYYRPIDIRYPGSGIEEVSFSHNGTVGYAIDAKDITKTVNGGQSWSVISPNIASFHHVQTIDDNNVFIYNTTEIGFDGPNQLYKSTNGGSSWQAVSLPNNSLYGVYFLTATTGWISTKGGIYQTLNGGASWTRQDNPAAPFYSKKIIFTDNQTGYSLGTSYEVYKTTDAGKIWEPLPRDNTFSSGMFGFNDLYCYNSDQLWAGGGHGFLELSTNGGGTPLPKAFFSKDTTGLYPTGVVNLTNHSKTSYSFKWFKNDTLIATTYHASYVRSAYPLRDTIKLVVSNGLRSDSAIQYQEYNEPIYITSFTPTAAKPATIVTINGVSFTGTTAVYFGGMPASSFTVVNDNTITAVVGAGSSGSVTVATSNRGIASLPGFTYLPPPTMTSFTPAAATAGTTITITGANLIDVLAIRIGGVTATNYTVVSPSTITVIAPSGKSGAVEVSTKGGIAQLPGFTAIPAITAFSPAIGTEGSILQIKGTSLLEVTGVTIGGMPAVSFAIISVDSMIAKVGLGATGSVTVTALGNTASQPGFTFANPPSVTSFAPLSGPISTGVTITGTNFNPVPSENIVLFGTLRAAVTAASTTSLTVAVPAGATLQTISVTANGLTGFSARPFHPTFTGGGAITPTSFIKTNITTEAPGIFRDYIDKTVADIDGDGKEDVLITDGWMAGMADILHNTTTTNIFSYNPLLKVASTAVDFVLADVDGDGLPDYIIGGGTSLQFYRNTSTPGNPSIGDWSNVVAYATPISKRYISIAINDVDKDGKTDVVAACENSMYVLRNIGEPGRIAFEPVELPYGGYDLRMVDIDLDGRPDIVQFSQYTGNITVYKNTSTKGLVSFTPSVTLPATSPYAIAAGDMDGDGLADIVSGSYDGNKIQVFRNTSAGNSIAFANPKEYSMPGITYDVVLADLDGNGKADIAAATDKFHFVTFTNISTGGNIDFEPSVNHFPGTYSYRDTRFRISMSDLNADGRPDPLLIDKNVQARICLYTNEAIATPYIREFTPAIASKDVVVTIKGRNFTGTTAVKFGGVPAAAFSIINDTTIQATVGTGATGNLSVTNNFGTTEADGFVYGSIPFISSFSPAKGRVGSQVVLTGSGFDPVPGNNIVYFGGVKTTAVAVTSTSLTVIVPAGASPNSITVTSNGRTAYSGKHFVVTFPGNAGGFSDSSFLGSPIFYPGGLDGFADLDRDGKNDLILIDYQQGISIARNTSTPGAPSFAPVLDLGMGMGAIASATGDLDGDGYIDVAAVSVTTNTFQVFRNTTTTGAISFASGISYKIVDHPQPGNDITIGDLDGDGRPEIIATSANARRCTVFKNLSTLGRLVFADPVQLVYYGQPYAVTCEDIDSDGKFEILILGAPDFGMGYGISVFKNTGPAGTLSFSQASGAVGVGIPFTMAFGDLDEDGRTDIASTGVQTTSFTINKNASTPGFPGFTGVSTTYPQAGGMAAVGMGDLDGDGRPDIILSTGSAGSFVYKNLSAPGAVLLKDKVPIAIGSQKIQFSDIDGDGALDIMDEWGRILLNRMAQEANIELCEGSDTTLLAGITSASYQWQQDTGNGFVDIQDNSNFSGTASSQLQLVDVPASWNGYRYRCFDNSLQQGGTYKLNIKHAGTPSSVSITTLRDTICTGSSITFTATPVNGGSAPSYQWQVNGINAGQNAATFGANTLSDGDAVKVIMTSNAACTSTPTAVSNIIPVTVRTALVPSITIKATPDTGCVDGPIVFKATHVNGGMLPVFQWIENLGGGSSDNIETYISPNIRNGLKVKVLMTVSMGDGCPTLARVYSNEITIGGDAPGDPKVAITPSVSITATSTNVCTGGSVTFTATPVDGGNAPVYQWQVNGVNVGQNSNTFTSSSLSGGDAVKVIMTGNAPCTIGPAVASNTITLTGGTPVTPSVSINASATSFCAGTEITFTATPINGGSSPAYQWQVNGINIGQNINPFTTTALGNDDKVSVLLTGSASCATIPSVASNIITVSVTPIITPAVTVTASATSICPGTTVYFTATTTNGISNPNYFWFVNGVGANGNDNTFNSSSLVDGDKVYATMFTGQSCVSDMLTKSNEVPISVNTAVSPSVTITASATNICPGSNVTFTATPVNGGVTPGYEWLVNGVSMGTNSNTFITNGLDNGDQVSVIMTSSADCVTTNIARSNAIPVSVGAALTPSVSIAASAATICAGSDVIFTATPVNGGNLPTYQWKVNGVNVVGQNTNIFITNALTNGAVVNVVMTSNSTCASTTTATSNSIPVTVNATATPSVSITATATTICAGTNVTFTAAPVNGGSAPSYQWKVNGANVGQNTNTFTTNALTNGAIVNVVMTTNLACASTNADTSNSIPVTVNAATVPSVSITATATTICTGANVTFTAAPVNGGSAPSYQWQVNGVNVGQNSNTYSSNSLANGAEVKVVLTSNAACASTTTATSNVIPVTVNTAITSSVSITSSTTAVCAGTPVTFTATPVNGGNTPAYQWYKNTALTGTNSPVYVDNTLRPGDMIHVSMTSSAACAAAAISNVIGITSSPIVTPSITLSGNVTVSESNSTLITASVTNAGNAPVYQWQDSTATHSWQLIPGITGGTLNYTPLQTGDKVRCALTSNAPCVSPSTVVSAALTFEVNTTGGRVAPNPVEGTLHIDGLKLSDNWETVEIASVSAGNKLVIRSIINQTSVSIPVSQLSKGLYIAVLRSKTGATRQLKFLKQ